MEYFVSEYAYLDYMDKFQTNSLLAKVLAYYHFDKDKLDQLFINKNITNINNDPCIHKVKDRIQRASATNELIFVCGDYDADGICSTAMMVGLLRDLGIMCGYYIPNRLKDGYGLNVDLVESVYQKGYSLIITVDNGVKAFDALDRAKQLNIDVIICDHHIIEDDHAFTYIIHPSLLPSEYQHMCGGGVVLQLIKAFGQIEPKYQILAMAATIGDMVEMFDANRLIVKEGLRLINEVGYLPIQELIDKEKTIDEQTIAFRFVPALNTIGRLADQANANVLVEYLLSSDMATIQNTARNILDLNDRRKKMVSQADHKDDVFFEAVNYNLYISSEYHEGVIGLLANRFMIEHQKPTLVGTNNGDNYKFSGRSIIGFDMYQQLSKYQSLFSTFGGHKQACGFTIAKEDIDQFIKYLMQEDKVIDDNTKHPLIKLELSDISFNNVKSLDALRPHGTGIKQPLFVLDPLHVDDYVLLKGKYPKAKSTINNEILEIISFKKEFISEGKSLTKHIIGRLSINKFRGLEKMSFTVEDVLY